ncbi:MAG: hypothetical protein ISR76_07015 [Planctomycetes bacterium]|nr:hypothetical protein [Planctomycetota bacterium]
MNRAGSWIAPLFLVLLVSWGAREAREARFSFLPDDGSAPAADGSWFSAEPDGLYHVRRVERALDEGLPPAATDAAMSFPDGADIPWPPYYDALLTVVLKPVAGEAPASRPAVLERRARLERAAATLPMGFGIGISMLLAVAGAAVAGRAGLLAAGLLHALSYGAIHYSVPGIADHHAFVGLLLAALLLLVSEAIRRGALERAGPGWRFGAAAGVCAGLLLGTWVASLVYLLVVQMTLGLLIARDARRGAGRGSMAGLAPFGIGFHLAALLTVMPAVLQSPWAASQPWMVVNLSWFHPLLLTLGGLVFVPLLRLPAGSAARRRYPAVVAAALALLAAGLWLLDAGPAAGIREGFAWSARANDFMGDIAESQPLLGPDRFATGGLFGWLGYAVLLAPLAWGFGLLALRRKPELLPWLVALPVLLAQALVQRRFTDAASIPLALLVGWWIVDLMRRLRPRRIALAAAAGSALLLQLPSLAGGIDALQHRADRRRDQESVRMNGMRAAYSWLGDHSVAGGSVMAHWDQGHAIELLTGMGSVATNFGSYVGEEAFRDSARFFTSTDFESAEWLLERRESRFVLVHTSLIWAWDQLGEVAGAADAEWLRSMGGTLFRPDAASGPDYLRLRWISPFPELDAHPRLLPGAPLVPAAMVYEWVPGARLAVVAEPGSEVSLELPVRLPEGGADFVFRRSVVAGPDGRARFRLPYHGKVKVRRGGAAAEVLVAEDAVLGGEELVLG